MGDLDQGDTYGQKGGSIEGTENSATEGQAHQCFDTPRHSTEIHDLKSLSAKEVSDVLKKAKTSKVGFVILNAPFKVRPVETIS